MLSRSYYVKDQEVQLKQHILDARESSRWKQGNRIEVAREKSKQLTKEIYDFLRHPASKTLIPTINKFLYLPGITQILK